MRVLKPASAYRFNADIQDHVELEYAGFVAEHVDDERVHKRISLDRLTRAR